MVDLFTELKQDMKEEQLLRWWQKNRFFLVGTLAAVLILTAVYSWRSDYVKTNSEEYSLLYDRATALRLEEDKRMKLLNKVVQDAPLHIGSLGHFQQAFLLTDQNKYADAVALYDGIANNASYDPIMREFAQLRAVFLLVEHDVDNASIVSRLDGLTTNDNAWKYTALELKVMYLLSVKEATQALAVIQTLLDDPLTPSFLQHRIEKISHAIK